MRTMISKMMEEVFSVHRFRRGFALLTLLMMLLSLALSAMADPLDSDTPGSLKVRILDTKTKAGVPGGKVSIYRVADVDDFEFVLNADFARSGFDVATIGELSARENIAQARNLERFVSRNRVKAVDSGIPDNTGTVLFKNLPMGLYLVVQTEAASKHEAIDSFLITIPQKDGDEYVYDVDAAPKTGTADTVPTTSPTRPHHGGLPQTGQLWWPVYLLAAAGASLFLFGLYRRKRSAHE